MGRRKTKISKPKTDTFAIVVDGNTEVWYFQMLKRNEKDLIINIEPKLPQRKKLRDLYQRVTEFTEYYTKVFWIIDLDVIIKEAKETKTGSESKIQELKKYLSEIENNYDNVITILNNPCLEFWFLLHFKQTTKYFPKCQNAERELKKYLPDYEKTEKYFLKEGNDIYLRLRPYLETALKNVKSLQRKTLEELERAICEMNLFFETEEIKRSISN